MSNPDSPEQIACDNAIASLRAHYPQATGEDRYLTSLRILTQTAEKLKLDYECIQRSFALGPLQLHHAKAKAETMAKETLRAADAVQDMSDELEWKSIRIGDYGERGMEPDQCSICHGAWVNAQKLQCGHEFCRWCLRKWMKKHRHCQTCRVRIDESKIVRAH